MDADARDGHSAGAVQGRNGSREMALAKRMTKAGSTHFHEERSAGSLGLESRHSAS